MSGENGTASRPGSALRREGAGQEEGGGEEAPPTEPAQSQQGQPTASSGQGGGQLSAPQQTSSLPPQPARHQLQQRQHESPDDEESAREETPVIGRPRETPARGYWGSRPPSPGGSESSSNMPPPRSRSRMGPNSKYDSLNYWRAKRVVFYKNGDPYFPGLEYRFRPGRDVTTMEALLDRLSTRMDLPRGARFVFTMEGARVEALDELEDSQSYVVSSYKTFKVGSGRRVIDNDGRRSHMAQWLGWVIKGLPMEGAIWVS